MKEDIRNLPYTVDAKTGDVVSTNKVLRNTYMLLALTVAFSAICAMVGTAIELSSMASLLCMLAGFGALFWVHKTADTAQGLVAIFVFTGLLGFSLGHILNIYLGLANGSELVFQAMAGTALVFFGLSFYVLTTRKDFSFLGGFLMVGLIVALVGMLVNLFLNIPVLTMAFPAMIVLLMSGLILYDTSRIVHGGETNYIRATVGLYLNLYNLFVSLLQLSGLFGGDE
jgi:Integral membrane protein, interacts with FtsH